MYEKATDNHIRIVFGISLLGLIILQTSYFQTAYEVKKEQFFYSANRAMDDMVDYIRKQEEAGRLSENRNLSEARSRGVEIDAPIYIDPKRPIAVKMTRQQLPILCLI